MIETNKRSITKMFTYKLSVLIEGSLVTYLITGNLELSILLQSTKQFIMSFAYYFHERLWDKILWGRNANDEDSNKRSISKMISYKILIIIIGLSVTYALTGDLTLTLLITASKNITSAIVYYIHERIWSRNKWGMIEKENIDTVL
jgi:uncharacterized membrane protein